MTEEKYKNGDITWSTYSGVFKAFDKDGNEIKFSTEDTGYQVKLDVQSILNLYEENKRLKRTEELRIAQIENLKQENEKLKKEKQEIQSYLGIGSKSILKRLEEIYEWKDNDKLLLWKYRSALEEIRDMAQVSALTICWSVLNFCDECKGDCEDQSPIIKLKEIVNKINEVLK